jgi:cytochrome c oxidase assembly factor 2
VVGLPHVLPCPAPRVLYADDGTPIPRKRQRRPVICEGEEDGEAKGDLRPEESFEGEDVEGLEGGKRTLKRECPVPKPGGIVGEILGFKSSSGEGKGNRPP